jgi:hypothetical protein
MAIRNADKANFETMLRAARAGHLALVECKDAATGEYRAVIAAIVEEGDEYLITPFGHLAEGNPFETYIDPGKALDMDKAAGRA